MAFSDDPFINMGKLSKNDNISNTALKCWLQLMYTYKDNKMWAVGISATFLDIVASVMKPEYLETQGIRSFAGSMPNWEHHKAALIDGSGRNGLRSQAGRIDVCISSPKYLVREASMLSLNKQISFRAL